MAHFLHLPGVDIQLNWEAKQWLTAREADSTINRVSNVLGMKQEHDPHQVARQNQSTPST